MSFDSLSTLDTTVLDSALAELRLLNGQPNVGIDSRDDEEMEERFEAFCQYLRPIYERGFTDGFRCGVYLDQGDKSGAYRQGFGDGYSWGEMLTAQSESGDE